MIDTTRHSRGLYLLDDDASPSSILGLFFCHRTLLQILKRRYVVVFLSAPPKLSIYALFIALSLL